MGWTGSPASCSVDSRRNDARIQLASDLLPNDTSMAPLRPHSIRSGHQTEGDRQVACCLVAANDPLAWHEFFVGTIGASAALTGLLFVAISINLEQILKYPQLPGRAAGTLGILVSALVVSGFVLIPGQGSRALGLEIAIAGGVVAAQAIWVTHPTREEDEPNSWLLEHLLSLLIPCLIFIAGGLSLIAGGGGGLYWVCAGTLLTFVAASLNAWVLLVEIKR
jgi:hypothetical protein